MSRKTLKLLTVPGGVLLLGMALLVSLGWLTLAPPAVSFLYYCFVAGGMLLAWRFHSSRSFFALAVLFLAQQGIALASSGQTLPGTPGWVAWCAVGVLVPVNFVLIGLMEERGFSGSSLATVGLFLFMQAVVVAVLCRGAETALRSPSHRAAAFAVPAYVWGAFLMAGAFLLLRAWLSQKPVDSAMFWSLVAFFLFMRLSANARLAAIYAATAAVILAASIIETSYLLAYHDELTTLPSRRAFHDAMLKLQGPFAIAVVDIDHFKQFNDTYGHDTGDQVLRLVAANLAKVTGGGQAYRCGGEEFNILFPGKTTSEVVDPLERLRWNVENSEFRLRGIDRRRAHRGADRRTPRAKGRTQKGHAIRQLSEEKTQAKLSVTVSIGVAESTEANPHPDSVLQAADKALYRAKANGRNRLELASPLRRRADAAGIA